ncbi:MAG: monooxygenase [Frankiaceae bacterium]
MQTNQVVSLHLWGVPARRVPAALAAVALDRRSVLAATGCTFAKLLGTGHARTFTLRDADLRHWGLLAVWSAPRHLADFERAHPVPRRWAARSHERWRAVLRPTAARGRWSRQEPFQPTHQPGRALAPGTPVAAITRARLRWRRAHRFWRAVPPVAAAAEHADGLLWAIGIGEAPVGLQGTFSVWRDAAALRSFPSGEPAHRAVVERTRQESWYAEELFARFVVMESGGTVAGCDPLAGPAKPGRHGSDP